jgi:hypothetical protein
LVVRYDREAVDDLIGSEGPQAGIVDVDPGSHVMLGATIVIFLLAAR